MARCFIYIFSATLLFGASGLAHAQFWRRSADTEPQPAVEEVLLIQPTPEPVATGPVPAEAVLAEPGAAEPALAEPGAVVPSASVGGRGEMIEKRAMYRLRDQETVDTLVRLAAGRQLREQELVVVSRLIREKEMELAAFDERLLEQFGVSSTGNYHYDNERRIIFKLRERAEGESGEVDPSDPLSAFDKSPLRRLRDEETEALFLRLVGAKRITSDQIRSLQLIVQEKRIELSNILDALRQQFSMDADKHYEYDAETRVVYELIYAEAAES